MSDWAHSTRYRNHLGKREKSAGVPYGTDSWLLPPGGTFYPETDNTLFSVGNALTSFGNALPSRYFKRHDVFTLTLLSSLPVSELREPVPPQI